MKKNFVVLAMVLAVSMSLAAAGVFAGNWNADPSNDPAFTKFLNETADIRKEIAMDRAELNALMAGENPDAKRVRDLTASIADNQEKLSEIARTNDLGASAPGTRGCGGPRNGRGSCGGCGGTANGFGVIGQGPGGNGSCGTPGCPGAGFGR